MKQLHLVLASLCLSTYISRWVDRSRENFKGNASNPSHHILEAEVDIKLAYRLLYQKDVTEHKLYKFLKKFI